jgi:hypothetical protein
MPTTTSKKRKRSGDGRTKEYDVQEIIGQQYNEAGEASYLIKFDGYPRPEWIPVANLNCDLKLAEWRARVSHDAAPQRDASARAASEENATLRDLLTDARRTVPHPSSSNLPLTSCYAGGKNAFHLFFLHRGAASTPQSRKRSRRR